MKSKFRGTGVALATPLTADLSVDYVSLKRLLNYTIEGNVDYLVVLGTTGEAPVFSWTEKCKILDFVIENNAGRKPVVLGLGGNHTQALIEKLKETKTMPIDAILSVSPYYNKPSQQGLIRHYTMLAEASPWPIILYNIPARTASNMEVKTTLTLAKHENIIAVKEASGNLLQCIEIIQNKPNDFMLLSGEDDMALEMIKHGAEGAVSVIANILPKLFTQMIHDAMRQRWTEATQKNKPLEKAYKLLAAEGNPSSLKTGLSLMNLCKDTVRPPLTEGSKQLEIAWKEYMETINAKCPVDFNQEK